MRMSLPSLLGVIPKTGMDINGTRYSSSMTTATTTRNLVTVAYLTSVFQRSHAEIAKAVRLLNIEPAVWINQTAHFDGASLEQLRQHFAQERTK